MSFSFNLGGDMAFDNKTLTAIEKSNIYINNNSYEKEKEKEEEEEDINKYSNLVISHRKLADVTHYKEILEESFNQINLKIKTSPISNNEYSNQDNDEENNSNQSE